MNISIITPVLNEAQEISGLLRHMQGRPEIELIIVDGGSTDTTCEIVRQHKVRLINSQPGRGIQQNTGAKAAAGDILLFLHCDTRLPHNFTDHLQEAFKKAATVAGAFHLKIDSPGAGYRVIEWGANLRSKIFQLPYGDQAIFVRTESFQQAGGFPDQPILEEIPLLKRLKRLGRIAIVNETASTSARRWQRLGLVRTTMLNQLMLSGLLFGVNRDRLARLYTHSAGSSNRKS